MLTNPPALHTDDRHSAGFAGLYAEVRKKEQWLSTDAEVAVLPEADALHPHYKEWCMRKRSCKRLLRYLMKRKTKPMALLEVGCGNGWLSRRLADIPFCQVTGIDVNGTELNQAMRVFGKQPNLRFIHGDILHLAAMQKRYDVIVYAASVQYFPELKSTLRFSLLHLLHRDGELHILDSPLYRQENIEKARQKSRAYYHELGFPDMTGHYFHHLLDDLDSFNYKILYDPASLLNGIFTKSNPFYWIRVKN